MSRDWFQQKRQEWIAETLCIFGFLRREHIRKKFRISTQQASADIAVFMKEHPDAMEYDRSAKQYKAIQS